MFTIAFWFSGSSSGYNGKQITFSVIDSATGIFPGKADSRPWQVGNWLD
jgi:hypothetical protein